jgi:hypothetical protein
MATRRVHYAALLAMGSFNGVGAVHGRGRN